MELLLVAAKKEVVSDYSMVIREAKLVPMIMDVVAFTIQNAYEANYTVIPEEAVAIINVGATLCNINIVAGGTSAFTRDVTVGGNAFTEEIQKRLNVSQEEAEAWKIGSTGEGVSEVVPQEVEAVIASVADSVAGKFQRSLDFFLAATSDARITKIYLCGGSAKVPALQRALEEKSRTAVEVLDPFRKITVDERKFDMAFVQQHAAEAAVAVGLALRRPGDKQ
jgi:type IV pilus assembly protein PilM